MQTIKEAFVEIVQIAVIWFLLDTIRRGIKYWWKETYGKKDKE